MILVLTDHFTTNVQVTYTIDLQRSRKKGVREKIDIDHVKAATWDKVIAFMIETLPLAAKEGFDLAEYEMFIECHITHFVKI